MNYVGIDVSKATFIVAYSSAKGSETKTFENTTKAETFNFKERLVNVKLKDVDVWRTKYLSKNWVTERTNTLKKVS